MAFTLLVHVHRPFADAEVWCCGGVYNVYKTALAKGLFIGFTHTYTLTRAHRTMRKKISDDRTIGGEEGVNCVQYIIYIYRCACIYIVVHDTRCPGVDHLFIYFFPYVLVFLFFSYILVYISIILCVRVFFSFFFLTTLCV